MLSSEVLQGSSREKILLIVAHPDDEFLWAWKLRNMFNSVSVLCLTNKYNFRRKLKFRIVTRLLSWDKNILAYPDMPSFPSSEEDFLGLSEVLCEYIERSDFDFIATHNPDGEYGHKFHSAISELVSSVNKGKPLYYFDFEIDMKLKFDFLSKFAKFVYFGFRPHPMDRKHLQLSLYSKLTLSQEWRSEPSKFLVTKIYGINI